MLDSVSVPLGVRAFSLSADTGFTLNGKALRLHGVNKHQDHRDKGWGIADSDTDADFMIIGELARPRCGSRPALRAVKTPSKTA